MQSNENTQLIKVEQQRLRIHLKKEREISKHLTGRFPQKAFEGSHLVAIAHFFKHCSGGEGGGVKGHLDNVKKMYYWYTMASQACISRPELTKRAKDEVNYYGQTLFLDGILMDIMIDNA